MAKELKIAVLLNYAKSGVHADVAEQRDIDVSGTEKAELTQSIGTSEEAINLGTDIGTPGYVYLENLDATNFVSIRRATGEGNMIKLLPGEFALFRMAATAPYAIADTAACRLRVIVIET